MTTSLHESKSPKVDVLPGGLTPRGATPRGLSPDARLPRGLTAARLRLPSSHKIARHESCDFTYVVKSAVLRLDKTSLVTSRLGTHLLDSGWMNVVLHVACLIVVFLFFAPLSQPYVEEASDVHGTSRTVSRQHPVQAISASLMTIFGIFLLAHLMNRQMFFICAFSFDFMVIVGSGIMIQAVWYINWYLVFVKAGAFVWSEVPIRFLEFISNMCLYVSIGATDCITMRYSKRVAISLTIVLSFLAEFILVRFEWRSANFFADETLDWWLISTTPDEIYLSSKLQMLMFLAKAFVAYARGQPFSCIKADYEVPGRQVLVEQVMGRLVRQLTDTFTPSSCRASFLVETPHHRAEKDSQDGSVNEWWKDDDVPEERGEGESHEESSNRHVVLEVSKPAGSASSAIPTQL